MYVCTGGVDAAAQRPAANEDSKKHTKCVGSAPASEFVSARAGIV